MDNRILIIWQNITLSNITVIYLSNITLSNNTE